MKNIILKKVMAGSSKPTSKNWAELTKLSRIKSSLLTNKVAVTCI